MNEVFEEVSGLIEAHPDSPDRVYLDTFNYKQAVADADFSSAVDIPSSSDLGYLLGLEVVLVPEISDGVMVLDSSNYPKAADFQEGLVEPESL